MKQLSQTKMEAIFQLLLQTADYWIGKIPNLQIPSAEWDDFKKDISKFLDHPCHLTTAPDTKFSGFQIGVVNYHEAGHSFVAGPRTDKLFYVYALSIPVDGRIALKPYLEKTDQIHRLLRDKLQEETKKNFLAAVLSHPDADPSWKWDGGLPAALNISEWMSLLYSASLDAILKTPFTDTERCEKLCHVLKGDCPYIPCVYSDQLFRVYEKKLQFGAFGHFGEISISVQDEVIDYTKKCVKQFLKSYAIYRENATKKVLFSMLPICQSV